MLFLYNHKLPCQAQENINVSINGVTWKSLDPNILSNGNEYCSFGCVCVADIKF